MMKISFFNSLNSKDSGVCLSNYIIFGIYIYLLLPIIIFIIGWLRLSISVPLVLLLAIGLIKIFRARDNQVKIEIGKSDLETCAIIFLIILAIVYLSGIGRLSFQNWDHVTRNGVFEILVNNKWPVVKNFEYEGVDTKFLFIYYSAFWLPASLVGKLLGVNIGHFFLLLWSVIGVWFFWYLVCCRLQRVSLMPFAVFIAFSGLDVVGYILTSENLSSYTITAHIEWWAKDYQFSSFITQLFWVYNQAIPGWVITMLLLTQATNRNVILILGASLLFCPFPFIGAIPVAVYVLIRNTLSSKNINNAIMEIFSYENIVMGGISGIVAFVYLRDNSAGSMIQFVFNNKRGELFSLFLFAFAEILVYFFAVYRYQKKQPLLWISLFFLCLCPFIKVGRDPDFCMRASIPCLIVVWLLAVETIYKCQERKDKFGLFLIFFLLGIGFITPIQEFNRAIHETVSLYRRGQHVYVEARSEEDLMTGYWSRNYRGFADKSFFCKYLAKKKCQ